MVRQVFPAVLGSFSRSGAFAGCNYLASLITVVFYIVGCNRCKCVRNCFKTWESTQAQNSQTGFSHLLRETAACVSYYCCCICSLTDCTLLYLTPLDSHLRETAACICCYYCICSMFIDPLYLFHLNNTETLDSHLRETAACISYCGCICSLTRCTFTQHYILHLINTETVDSHLREITAQFSCHCKDFND